VEREVAEMERGKKRFLGDMLGPRLEAERSEEDMSDWLELEGVAAGSTEDGAKEENEEARDADESETGTEGVLACCWPAGVCVSLFRLRYPRCIGRVLGRED
jgi:hypothetical protein